MSRANRRRRARVRRQREADLRVQQFRPQGMYIDIETLDYDQLMNGAPIAILPPGTAIQLVQAARSNQPLMIDGIEARPGTHLIINAPTPQTLKIAASSLYGKLASSVARKGRWDVPLYWRLNGDGSTTETTAEEADHYVGFPIALTRASKLRVDELGASVSTTFLAIDHSFGSCDVPLVFETLVRGTLDDGVTERTADIRSAIEAHIRAAKTVFGESNEIETEWSPVAWKVLPTMLQKSELLDGATEASRLAAAVQQLKARGMQ